MSTEGEVLVTGAGGFIGGRVVEALHLGGSQSVRAGVRHWSSCARIGRFPVKTVKMNILDETEIREAMEGISVVIHCAKGLRDGIVAGTRNLVECAFKKGVSRFIYLSSIAVYGKARGMVNETQLLKHTGDNYADAKIDAENICMDFHKKGLPIVILRPSIVYGPHSGLWTEEVTMKLASGQWGTYEEFGSGKCNLLYIDDLVRAIWVCLHNTRALGHAFNINGPEVISWNDYFYRIQRDLGLPELKKHNKYRSNVRALMMEPIRAVARHIRDHHMGVVKWLGERSHFAKRLMKGAESTIKGTPSMGELALWSTDAVYQTDKAKGLLGFVPKFTVDAGLRITNQWFRHQAFLDGWDSV